MTRPDVIAISRDAIMGSLSQMYPFYRKWIFVQTFVLKW